MNERLYDSLRAMASRPAQDGSNNDNNSRHEVRTRFGIIFDGFHPGSWGYEIGQ
jgi:hypothetical protein